MKLKRLIIVARAANSGKLIAKRSRPEVIAKRSTEAQRKGKDDQVGK